MHFAKEIQRNLENVRSDKTVLCKRWRCSYLEYLSCKLEIFKLLEPSNNTS